jgi:hypothetical protein
MWGMYGVFMRQLGLTKPNRQKWTCPFLRVRPEFFLGMPGFQSNLKKYANPSRFVTLGIKRKVCALYAAKMDKKALIPDRWIYTRRNRGTIVPNH